MPITKILTCYKAPHVTKSLHRQATHAIAVVKTWQNSIKKTRTTNDIVQLHRRRREACTRRLLHESTSTKQKG